MLRISGLFGRDTNLEISFATPADDCDLVLHEPRARLCIGEYDFQFRNDVDQWLTSSFRLRLTDQTLSGTIENADAACCVDTDHAGAGSRQHGLRELAALIDQ